jgi:hypothetical protein
MRCAGLSLDEVSHGEDLTYSLLVAGILLLKDAATSERVLHGGLGLAWIVALAVQLYVGDTAVHAAEVGAYVPDLLLTTARIPVWAFLAPVVVEAGLVVAAGLTGRIISRALAVVSVAVLATYGLLAIAALFYVAFAPYG